VLTDKKRNEILKDTLSQAVYNSKSMSNGMLMRISPLGIALRNLEENV
jgi:ADP-ribosylglycohydrolase